MNTDSTAIPGEECDRCHEVDEDRRTLWMACLYQMSEMKLPFKEFELDGILRGKTGVKTDRFGPIPVFEGEGSAQKRVFYTLRVCKRCRADWMAAIADWFRNPSAEDYPEEGRNIPVRVLGEIKYITMDEWKQRREKADAVDAERDG